MPERPPEVPPAAGAEATAPRGPEAGPRPGAASSARGAFFVAAGILASRVLGLVRQRVFAHYFGSSLEAGAFLAALRIPNFLQNLFGEGALSASFIPVYAKRARAGEGEREAADRVAGAVFGLLSLVTAILVAAGIAATPWVVDAVAPGLEGEGRALTVRLVRILFPGTGLLVVSAWCLGILNSHRRFFLSYAAPVIWNTAIIAALVGFGGRRDLEDLAVIAAWGTVAGSLLQLLIQIVPAARQLGTFRPSLDWKLPEMREVTRGFVPALVSRGVVQISAFVDLAYASLITERALAVLSYAQNVSLLPVSLFGMSISAAELPELARAAGGADVSTAMRQRLGQALERVAFFVVPSACAFLALGDVIAGALFQSGRFTAADSRYAWYLLMGSGVGLLASTSGRLYASAFYALQDTRTPLKFAVVRVALSAALALLGVKVAPGALGIPVEIGAVAIPLASGIGAWVEYQLLSRALARRIGAVRLSAVRWLTLWGSALAAGGVGLAAKWALVRVRGADPAVFGQWAGGWLPAPRLDAVLTAVLVLGSFGVVYLGATVALRVPQASSVAGKVLRRLRR